MNRPSEIKHWHVWPGSDLKETIEHIMRESKRYDCVSKFVHNDTELTIYPSWQGFDYWVLLYINQWRRESKIEELKTLSEYGTK